MAFWRERKSTVKLTNPAITLLAPGHTLSWPTVHTSPSSLVKRTPSAARRVLRQGWLGAAGSAAPWQPLSTASTASAAAASVSRRVSMGTAPAWPCEPRMLTCRKVWPAMAVTTPSGTPRSSSTGPCSMCTSTYARTPSRAAAAPRMASPSCPSEAAPLESSTWDRAGSQRGMRLRARCSHLRHGDAVAILRAQHVRGKRAREDAAAQEGAVKAHPLLVAEGYNLDLQAGAVRGAGGGRRGERGDTPGTWAVPAGRGGKP